MKIENKQLNTNGFTLAEVLVTLAIIGIVAALTIPTLLQNTQESEYKAKWKKTFSNVSNAYNTFLNDQGKDAMGLFTNTHVAVNLLAPYLRYAKKCDWNAYTEECSHPANTIKNLNDPTSTFGLYPDCGFILIDGVHLIIVNVNSDCSGQNDNCIQMLVDVNGSRGPNINGKDVFGIFVLKNRIFPFGGVNGYWADRQCIQPPNAGWTGAQNTGMGCSLKYLTE